MSAAVTTVKSSHTDRRVEGDPANPAARHRASNRDAMQNPGRRDVVDVQRLTGDLGPAFLAARRPSDVRHFHVIRILNDRPSRGEW